MFSIVPIQEWKDEIFCPYQLLNELLSETILADILKDFVAALLTITFIEVLLNETMTLSKVL